MRKTLLAAGLAMALAFAAPAQVRVTGAAAKLSDLAGSPTLVTVVLKGGAKDSNLRVAEIHGETIHFVTEKGEQAIYTAASIEEIQVQGGAVEKKEVPLLKDVLAPGDKLVVERAYARAQEVFASANDKQNLKLDAATLLALGGNEDAKKYLQLLAGSGEIETELAAAEAMFLAGMEVPDTLLRRGLESGNRIAKGKAAELSGLTKYSAAGALLVRLALDRSWEVSAPACRAVARLGNNEIAPQLISGLNERNDEKAAAVMWSMLRLGDKDLVPQLKMRLADLQGVEKYRAVYCIYRLGDPEGKRMMLDIISSMPTLALQASIVLGGDGDVSSMDTLRQRLRRREDETEENFINRARTAAALIRGGDPTAKGVLQDLVRSDKAPVREATFREIVRLNNRTMLSLIQSSIENVDPAISMEAATTAVALGNSDFRARLMDLRAEEEAAIGDKK